METPLDPPISPSLWHEIDSEQHIRCLHSDRRNPWTARLEMPALDLSVFVAQLRELQQKETIAEVLAEPLARSLLAAAVGLLFVALLLVGPKKAQDKSDLDKALQGDTRAVAAT